MSTEDVRVFDCRNKVDDQLINLNNNNPNIPEEETQMTNSNKATVDAALSSQMEATVNNNNVEESNMNLIKRIQEAISNYNQEVKLTEAAHIRRNETFTHLASMQVKAEEFIANTNAKCAALTQERIALNKEADEALKAINKVESNLSTDTSNVDAPSITEKDADTDDINILASVLDNTPSIEENRKQLDSQFNKGASTKDKMNYAKYYGLEYFQGNGVKRSDDEFAHHIKTINEKETTNQGKLEQLIILRELHAHMWTEDQLVTLDNDIADNSSTSSK